MCERSLANRTGIEAKGSVGTSKIGGRVCNDTHSDEDREEVEPDCPVRSVNVSIREIIDVRTEKNVHVGEPSVVLQRPYLPDDHTEQRPDEDLYRETELVVHSNLCDALRV